MNTQSSESKALYGASVLVKSQSKFDGINQVSTDIPDFSDASKSLASFNTPNKYKLSRRESNLMAPKEDYIKKILGKP